jgi:hypothetical protein
MAVNRKYTINELNLVAVDDVPAPSLRFQLASPEPNPSRGSAGLRFAIPQAGRVRLAIYDVTGRLVRTLVDQVLQAGWHPMTWTHTDSRGARVASGVYMVRLEAAGEVRTRKMVLAR